MNTAILINKAKLVSVIQPRLCCTECYGDMTTQFAARGDINIVYNLAECKSSYKWITQLRLKIIGKQRGSPGPLYMQAAIAILGGSTYEKYAQSMKACRLEAIDGDTFYELTSAAIYKAAKTVWLQCREKHVFPHVLKPYYDICGADENGILPLSITFDTRWQKRGTGKAYNSLDATRFACDTLTGYVLSIANQHRATASDFRKRYYHSRLFTQSSHMMDPVGTILCIEDIMTTDYYVDVQCGLADGDGKWVVAAQKLKKRLQADLELCKKYPHLENISASVHQDSCLTHIQKNYIKLLKTSIADWKKQEGVKTLPTGSSSEKIVNYVQVAFHDRMTQKYNDTDDRIEAVLGIFDHLDEEADHESGICVNRDCSSSSNPIHIHFDPSLAQHLKEVTESYCDEDMVEHIKLLGTTNPLESLNQQMATIQPKFIMQKNPQTNDLFSIIVALKSNHGSNILHKILTEIGFPKNMIPPIITDHWDRLDNAKCNRRHHFNEDKFIARQKELERLAKLNDNAARQSNRKSVGSYEDYK